MAVFEWYVASARSDSQWSVIIDDVSSRSTANETVARSHNTVSDAPPCILSKNFRIFEI